MVNPSASGVGTLYIVATPIGHRQDISLRALEVLKSVDLILAEDTRHSENLLQMLAIKKPLSSMHAHNEASKCESILQMLIQGKDCALISDAGTPLISDPGFPLVAQARQAQIPVVPIPGACALITALSAAGVPCDRFTFVGFLPAKQAARRQALQELRAIEHSLIFYESTHRITESIDDIAFVFGPDSPLTLAKELTKSFERFVSGSCTEVKQWLNEDPAHRKGEFVLIIPARQEVKNHDASDTLLSILLEELPLKQAVKIAAKLTDFNKNELYQRALVLKKD
jgi:16S rRNA (cytidine1402-2'-O)-methyltransferase